MFLLIVGTLMFVRPHPPAAAQGCSQCTQAVGQTPPQTQAAYRKGIIVLVLAGGGVFASAIVVLRRFR